jgi:hypothetical protein
MPTSACWLNAVYGVFTKQQLQCVVFRSIVELQAAIDSFLAEANQQPRPSRWTQDPLEILAAVG